MKDIHHHLDSRGEPPQSFLHVQTPTKPKRALVPARLTQGSDYQHALQDAENDALFNERLGSLTAAGVFAGGLHAIQRSIVNAATRIEQVAEEAVPLLIPADTIGQQQLLMANAGFDDDDI